MYMRYVNDSHFLLQGHVFSMSLETDQIILRNFFHRLCTCNCTVQSLGSVRLLHGLFLETGIGFHFPPTQFSAGYKSGRAVRLTCPRGLWRYKGVCSNVV